MTSLVNEVPSGAIDGINDTFFASVPYSSGSLRAYVNGALVPAACVDQSGYLTGEFVLLLDDPLWVGWTLEIVFLDPSGSAGSVSCTLFLNIDRRPLGLDMSLRLLEIDMIERTAYIEAEESTRHLRAIRPVKRLETDPQPLELELLCPAT